MHTLVSLDHALECGVEHAALVRAPALRGTGPRLVESLRVHANWLREGCHRRAMDTSTPVCQERIIAAELLEQRAAKEGVEA